MPVEANVAIVGGGLMGGLVAELLAEHGMSGIVILEAGPPIVMRDTRTWLDVVMTGMVPYSKLYDDPTDFTATGAEPWNLVGGRLFGRGGSTVHWGGWAPRFMPEDFVQFTNTGLGSDWPYGYDDLERYYLRAERYLQVGGEKKAGQRDWRSTDYPMTPPPIPVAASPIIDALDALGISYQHMPLARNTKEINGQAQCRTITTCQYCPIGGRFTGNQPHDRLQESGRAQLVTNAAVTAVTMGSGNLATGINYVDRMTGEHRFLPANAVFLCAGALEIPKILLRSTSVWWPEGLGNAQSLIGTRLVANPYLFCRGYASENPQRWQQEVSFPTLCTRDYDTPADQQLGKFLMNMSSASPLLKPAKMIYQGSTAEEIAAAVSGQVNYELQGAMSAIGYPENRVTLASGVTRFGLPRTAISTPTPIIPANGVARSLARMEAVMAEMGFTVSASGSYPQRGDHAAGTCAMGNSPETSVVSTSLQMWGVNNVFVASNAILPAIGAANVTLTTVAAVMKGVESLLGTSFGIALGKHSDKRPLSARP